MCICTYHIILDGSQNSTLRLVRKLRIPPYVHNDLEQSVYILSRLFEVLGHVCIQVPSRNVVNGILGVVVNWVIPWLFDLCFIL